MSMNTTNPIFGDDSTIQPSDSGPGVRGYNAEVSGQQRELRPTRLAPEVEREPSAYVSRKDVEEYAQEFEQRFPRPDHFHELKRWPPENDMRYLAFLSRWEDEGTHARRQEIYHERQKADALTMKARAKDQDGWYRDRGVRSKYQDFSSKHFGLYMLWMMDPNGPDQAIVAGLTEAGRNSVRCRGGSVMKFKSNGRIKLRIDNDNDIDTAAKLLVREGQMRGWDIITLRSVNKKLQAAVVSHARDAGMGVELEGIFGRKLLRNMDFPGGPESGIPIDGKSPPWKVQSSDLSGEDTDAALARKKAANNPGDGASNNPGGNPGGGPSGGPDGRSPDGSSPGGGSKRKITHAEMHEKETEMAKEGVNADPMSLDFGKPIKEALEQNAPSAAAPAGAENVQNNNAAPAFDPNYRPYDGRDFVAANPHRGAHHPSNPVDRAEHQATDTAIPSNGPVGYPEPIRPSGMDWLPDHLGFVKASTIERYEQAGHGPGAPSSPGVPPNPADAAPQPHAGAPSSPFLDHTVGPNAHGSPYGSSPEHGHPNAHPFKDGPNPNAPDNTNPNPGAPRGARNDGPSGP